MSLRKKTLFSGLAVLIVLASFLAYGFTQLQKLNQNEDPTFWESKVAAIEARYDEDLPKDVIVFYGSSSIRKWETLETDMAPFTTVNHGFGGAKVADVTYFVDRLVTPFQPKAVVLFVGTNDINGMSGASKSGEYVFLSSKNLFQTIQSQLPGTPIYYISISPSKARWKVWEEANTANLMISDYASKTDLVTFIDTSSLLLGGDGLPNDDLFVWDGLHLNAKGYEVWTSAVYPVLQSELN